LDLILKYFPELTPHQQKLFLQLLPLYREWNSKINLISRKDLDNFYERHVLHSLAIARVIRFQPHTRILDIGTGGGFPGIPLAIMFPDSNFYLADSISKKILAVKEVSLALSLKNVTAIHSRVETLKGNYDFITARAVASTEKLIQWTRQLVSKKHFNLLPNGWLFLKGGELSNEISRFRDKTTLYAISSFYSETYFKEKWVVYISSK
jgi:16S rRNA (guanine527-N7)-methyltransferase